MRIIEQYNTIDIPYERAVLCVYTSDDAYFITANIGVAEEETVALGNYKTKERCVEIMREIRKAYDNFCKTDNIYARENYFYMPKE